jgi:hypothetical protein
LTFSIEFSGLATLNLTQTLNMDASFMSQIVLTHAQACAYSFDVLSQRFLGFGGVIHELSIYLSINFNMLFIYKLLNY